MPRNGVGVRGIRDLMGTGRSGPQQGPLSVHTPAGPPGMSFCVHHFAVHWWPLYDTTAPPVYAVEELHAAAVHVPPPPPLEDEVDVVGGGGGGVATPANFAVYFVKSQSLCETLLHTPLSVVVVQARSRLTDQYVNRPSW